MHTYLLVVCDVQALAAQLGAKPEFIVVGASYHDINQGQLGISVPLLCRNTQFDHIKSQSEFSFMS